jgi:hypothetical protein
MIHAMMREHQTPMGLFGYLALEALVVQPPTIWRTLEPRSAIFSPPGLVATS